METSHLNGIYLTNVTVHLSRFLKAHLRVPCLVDVLGSAHSEIRKNDDPFSSQCSSQQSWCESEKMEQFTSLTCYKADL